MTRRPALALVAAALITLAGCTTPTSTPSATPTISHDAATNQHEADTIATHMRTVPAVTHATVEYTPTDFTACAGIRGHFTITTTDRAEYIRIDDEFRHAVWTSHITPLCGLAAGYVTPTGPKSDHASLDEIATEMTTRYGPRPVPLRDR